MLLVAAVLPFVMKLAYKSTMDSYHSSFNRTVQIISFDFDNSVGIFSAALAYYIKKFFLPLPLSFAISDIAPGYLFAGIAVIILTAFLAAWRSQAAILFLAGIALLLPVLTLVHNQIAWAPYAERYVYISSAFWISSLAVGINSLSRPSMRTLATIACLLLIPAAAVISYNRSIVWQTNVGLFADAVQKSPQHLDARILYMKALSQAGNIPDAMVQFRRIITESRSGSRVKYFNDFAELLYKCGMKKEAWEVLESTLSITLPMGMKHPLRNDEWKRLYEFHIRLQKELFP
jgi:hypothetical protein